jgi:hypothetical protein
MVLTERGLLRVTNEVGPGDMVVMPDLSPTHPREELFGPVRVDPGAVAVELRMVDPGHLEPPMQIIP